MTRFITPLILCCGLLVLAGCEDDSTKAERYFQSGLALIEEGDNERAMVELRNVFQHDGFHKEARETYANLMLEMGRTSDAYSQYLRLIEQYPDTLHARVILAELAIESGSWEEVERHGEAAIALAPERNDVKAIDLVLQYRAASLDKDFDARATIAAEATTLLQDIRSTDGQENSGLVRVTIDQLIQTDQPDAALQAIETALERSPENVELNLLKARLLAEVEDVDGLGAQLQRMVTIMPENTEVKQSLINWFMIQQDTDGAEAFLRTQAGEDTGPTDGHMSVIQLLQSTKGEDAAKAEITRLMAANEGTENGRFYSAMLISLDFMAGNQDQAIADLRAVIEAAEAGDTKNRMRIALFQMLVQTGAQAEADALVETILADDSSNVAALRLQASRLIREDKPGEAIIALRRALDQDPRDTATLTLMAQAHERDGDTNLAGERLSLAMEASGNAVPEAIRYARFLIGESRPQVAINVLEDARRRVPNNPQLLQLLANLYVSAANWTQAESIVEDLGRINTPNARQIAIELQAQILRAQNRTADSLKALEAQLSAQTDADTPQNLRTTLLIIQTNIQNGDTAAARTALDAALSDNPENPDLLLLDASLRAVMGEIEAAEQGYRALVARFPQIEMPARLLFRLLNSTGQQEAANAVLDDALERMPDDANLLYIKASLLQQKGDFNGAIAVYDDMYSRDTSNPVVANNLASLITTHRDDPESLSRAVGIARRLRGTEVPAFQDTYGWISYRRGEYDEALAYLEPAAAGMQGNALVQYHLGMTYAALSRRDDAKRTLERALEIAGDSPLPQFDTARATLKELSQAP